MILNLVVAFAFASSALCIEDHRKLKKQFLKLDEDGDGFLTTNDIFAILDSGGYRPSFSDLLLYDVNKNGKLSLNDWMNMHSEIGKLEAFDRVVDKDHDGYATFEELYQFYREAGKLEAECRAKKIMALRDTNRDGFLDRDEFKTLGIVRSSDLDPVFQDADKDGDGLLSLDELETFIIDRSDGRNERLARYDLMSGDRDNDQKISREEWVKYVRK